MTRDLSLADRVAVVTGGGRGIGAASAIALAEAGADVVISARSTVELHEVRARIESAGRRALVVAADLSDGDEASGLVEQAVLSFGRLDVVVNNVGAAMKIKPFSELTPGDLQAAFAFNVGTAHAVTRAAVPYLLEGTGTVVNITSTVGRVGGRGWLAYGTAKAALAHYTRLAAYDLAPRIRVNAVSPGVIDTLPLRPLLTDTERRREVEEATPMRKIGSPEDVAAAVLYLASPASAFVTGKIIEVDGGVNDVPVRLGFPDL
nr:glucose 1-dehydrogenase [Amycolatopsis decaplanina]